jgi:hypothetical protein
MWKKAEEWAIERQRAIGVETGIDPVVSQSLNLAMGKKSEKQNLWIL